MNLKVVLDRHARWAGSDGSSGERATLIDVDLSGRDLAGSDLRWGDLRWCDLNSVDLRDSNLSRCSVYWSDLSKGNLLGSRMRGADLIRCDMREADLSRCNLARGNLSESDLRGSSMRGCDLSRCNLRDSDLRGADLSGCDIRWSILPNSGLLLPRYHVSWWGDQLAIGCQQHTLEEWADFSEEEIAKMDTGALPWWRTWKEVIFRAIETSNVAAQARS